MATKPTNTIDWTPADPADIIEPSGADKTGGFDPGQKPPAQWFNWFWNLVTGWVLYLRDGVFVGVSGQPGLTATGSNNKGLVGVGNGAGNSGVKGTGASIAPGVEGFGGSSGGNGVEGTGGTSSGAGVVGRGGTSGGAGTLGYGTGAGVGVLGQSETGSGVKALKGSSSGTIGLETDGTMKFTGSNPSTTTGLTNELTQALVPKAWATIELVSAGNPVLRAGANVASVALQAGTPKRVRVTFATALTGSYPGAAVASAFTGTIGGGSNAALQADINVISTTYVDIELHNPNGTNVDADSVNGFAFIHVDGLQ